MFSATTKKSYIIERAEDTCDILEDALNTAFNGRPGPVHIHIPKDITTAEVPNFRPVKIDIKPVPAEDEAIKAAATMLAEAIGSQKKMLAIVGYGCVRSECAQELMQLIEKYQIPFVQTMDARGLLPENHPLCLGQYGTSGDPAANTYFTEAECVLAMGNSFAQNATFAFKPDLYDGKQLIHINIDPAEIGKVYKADVAVVSDVKLALEKLLPALEAANLPSASLPVLPTGKYFEEQPHTDAKKLFPGDIVRLLSNNLPEDAIVMGDAGSHMLWLSAYLQLNKNQRYQNPGSFGPMASHTNGCIGVKCANPDKVVIAGVGDGCYQMAGFELMTAVQYDIPVIWIIFNNNEFNIIKKFLLNMYGDEAFMTFDNPDFMKYAEACGAKAWHVEKLDEFVPALQEAIKLNKPCIIDVVVDNEVYPPFNLGKV
jgi:acetolactate synthase-1/2/3 large subunit